MSDREDVGWQRLDKWLWCARFMRQRADCAALVGQGGLRINRMPTDKPHAKLRVGDVITLPLRGAVRVIEVRALADFRLEVGFADGTRGGVDMASFLSRDCGVFMPLRDAALFRRAYLNEGAVTWPGDLDLAPDRMHEELKKGGVYVMK